MTPEPGRSSSRGGGGEEEGEEEGAEEEGAERHGGGGEIRWMQPSTYQPVEVWSSSVERLCGADGDYRLTRAHVCARLHHVCLIRSFQPTR